MLVFWTGIRETFKTRTDQTKQIRRKNRNWPYTFPSVLDGSVRRLRTLASNRLALGTHVVIFSIFRFGLVHLIFHPFKRVPSEILLQLPRQRERSADN